MRIGRNPFKGKLGRGKAYIPKQVTVCVLTYIPNFSGYYSERFEVMKASISSLLANTEGEYDLLILDNGSCDDVIEYLQKTYEEGSIQYLIRSSRNLGYNGALNFIFSAAPGEFIAFADDDVFYHPDWLRQSLAILNSYPNVGYVTACPVKTNYGKYDTATQQFIHNHPDIVNDEVQWNSEWDVIHANSLGGNVQERIQRCARIHFKGLSMNKVKALPVSTHFQFLIKKDIRSSFLPFKYGNLMSSEINDPDFDMSLQFDKKLDDAGLIKLSTYGLFTEHLGNVISPRLIHLIKKYKLNIKAEKNKAKITLPERILFRILRTSIIKNFFKVLYNFSFKVIHWNDINK